MSDDKKEITQGFAEINDGYNRVFRKNKLTIGLVVPLEHYPNGAIPHMHHQLQRIQLAEKLGFAAVWLRDVPLNIASFGDVGQIYDPFVYLGVLAANTTRIALGVASIILPLRHPAHVAKSAASVDVLSHGRLILGIASGDRAEEYPALNFPYHQRGTKFRECYQYIKKTWADYPVINSNYGDMQGHFDMLPKPYTGQFPLLITGASQQNDQWLAEHGDGWMVYPRTIQLQEKIIKTWRNNVQKAGRAEQPVMQPLYIDLQKDPNSAVRPVHLGLRTGVNGLKAHITSLANIGVNHIALNLRFNQRNIEETLQELAEHLLVDFSYDKE